MFKFIVTKELGKLARWLRILGFDTAYYTSETQGTLIIKALSEGRIVVTRCRRASDSLDKITLVINSDKLKEQLREVMKELHLSVDEGKMFTRCTFCNGMLERTDKDGVKESIPEYVFKTHNEFMKCASCGKIYWRGTHWGNIQDTLNKILR
ncbi:MAG: hypothetical protein B1H08_01095 [Candidatus Omnitrophica bacterium 4484_171]|nr:MAG: hypothetical protein B1H08_01095 [Candidatus Omnitrophica bacterium 4484_171]